MHFSRLTEQVPLWLSLLGQNYSPNFGFFNQNEILLAGESCSGRWKMQGLEKGYRLFCVGRQG